MPKKTKEQKIRELEGNLSKIVEVRVEKIRRVYTAQLKAKIDLMKSNLTDSRERNIYYRERYYIYMGKTQERATALANFEQHHYDVVLQLQEFAVRSA